MLFAVCILICLRISFFQILKYLQLEMYLVQYNNPVSSSCLVSAPNIQKQHFICVMSVSPASLALKTKVISVFSTVTPRSLPSVYLFALAHKTCSINIYRMGGQIGRWMNYHLAISLISISPLIQIFTIFHLPYFPQDNTLEIFKQFFMIRNWVTALTLTYLTHFK